MACQGWYIGMVFSSEISASRRVNSVNITSSLILFLVEYGVSSWQLLLSSESGNTQVGTRLSCTPKSASVAVLPTSAMIKKLP